MCLVLDCGGREAGWPRSPGVRAKGEAGTALAAQSLSPHCGAGVGGGL